MFKFFIASLMIISSSPGAFNTAEAREVKNREIYYLTPFGRVRALTPKERREMKEKEFKDKYGRSDKTAGVEFKTRAIREKKDKKEILSVYVRGCGKIKLKALTDSENEQKSLDKIKNGDPLKVKMIRGKKCVVGSWDKIFN